MAPVLTLDQPVPAFSLPDLHGRFYSPADFRGRVLIINFWSPECPWAERTDWEISTYLPRWGPGVALLPIASNASEPLELLVQVAAERALPLVLRDAKQRVADQYGAQTTPHLFVIDPAGLLRYQGAFDDVTFRQRTPTRSYLKEAVEALLAGEQPRLASTPAYGCTIVRHPE